MMKWDTADTDQGSKSQRNSAYSENKLTQKLLGKKKLYYLMLKKNPKHSNKVSAVWERQQPVYFIPLS